VLSEFAKNKSAHPFVKATAELCTRAIKKAKEGEDDGGGAIIDRYVWDDEGVVVSRAPRDLEKEGFLAPSLAISG
jgi:hypothetical protein